MEKPHDLVSTGDPPYPPYVVTSEDQRRWDLAQGIARSIFEEDGPAAIWLATRSIYKSGLPT